MSEVRLQVGGRPYTVSVADGQEESLRQLAEMVDAKIAGMGTNLSPNEAKNLLFAAILLADELVESKKRLARVEAHSPEAGANTPELASKLESLAAALENAASTLEGRHSAS